MRAMSHRVRRIRAVSDCTSSSPAARPACWSTVWSVQAARRRSVPSTGGTWWNGGFAVNADRCLCGVTPSRSLSNTPRARSGEQSQAPSDPAAGSEPLVSPINIPNALTLSRILATPVFIHWINLGHYDLVLGGFFAAAITDFFDGYLARKWKQITAVGSFMDPLADKVLVNGLAVPLAIQGMLPGSLVALICGRDLAIIAGVLYSRALTIEGEFTWKKYVNVSNSTPQNLKPTNISKINTVLQCTVVVLACGRTGSPSLRFFALPFRLVMQLTQLPRWCVMLQAVRS